MKNKIQVSDYILSFLQKKGVKDVFLMNGGAIAFVVDAFSRNKEIKYTCVAHEQSAAMMADAYSRLGPNFSATMVTSGPGATNLITGIACSWFDSIPTMHICGQVNINELSSFHKSTKYVRQIGFQETDIVSMVKNITKFAYQVKNESEIAYVLEKAYHVARSGRPGPVVIDIPMNIQKKIINLSKIKKYKFTKVSKTKNLQKKISDMYELLKKSNRPCVLLGGGIRISNSINKLKKFLDKLDIPVVTTWSGVDSYSHYDKKYVGSVGVYGSRAANLTIQNCDLLICLGTRLDTRITGGTPSSFARSAKIVSVDIDHNELNKKRGLNIDLKINCDLNIFFDLANQKKNFFLKNLKWMETALKWKDNYPNVKIEYYRQKKYVNPYVFMNKLSGLISKNETIIPDSAGHLAWTIQGIKLNGKQRLFTSFGHCPMGYGLPAAIGASIALDKKRIILIDGEGSIQLNIQELQTLSSKKLPIKIFNLNNDSFGIIKQFQELYLGKRFEATKTSKGLTNPDFKKIAYSYNINYNVINVNKDIEKVIKKVLKSKNPEFVDVFINPEQKIMPKLAFGDPIEDLSPKLPRKEFFKNMVIKPVTQNKKIIEAN